MLGQGGPVKVYVATRPVDFRKGIDGLALAVQEMFGLDPFCGAVFVFRAKRADRIKILVWDQTGMVLVHKRLEGGKFVWPQVRDGVMRQTLINDDLDAFTRIPAMYGNSIAQLESDVVWGIITANPEFSDVLSLEGVADTKNPSVPIFGVPTTAGTASETTINYVITDTANKRKFVAVDPHDIPQVAFIDADMMDGMPPALKAATGVDALTHAIEGYITRGAWALTDALHIKAIEIIAGALRGSVAGDKDAGEEMALGQYVAGMGFSNVGLGLVHGMAHPLGAFYNTPHGVANAILLPHVMRYNADFTGEKYRDIARVMGVKVEGMSLEEARNAAVEAVFALNRDVGIPPHLRDVGVRKEDIPALAQAALDDVCTGGNPREATLEDIVELYHTAW